MTKDSLLNKQFDEYRLEKMLGRGGMARVYRAIDTRLNRYTAIKVIDAPFRGDSEYARRFDIEAQAFAQLHHPNIVAIYRYGEVDGLLYMAMQYVEGADLGRLILDSAKGEFFPLDETLKILRQLCDALDYTHQMGVIHRDVKPSNIMVDNDGRAFLTDFGLALLTEVGTKGEIFGSPHYVAPEQAISSAGAVPQSDFYALGVVLYEMLTGKVPFDAENSLDIAMLHMTETPPPPRQYNPDLPPAVEAVILKMLSKEPEERYPDGKSLAAAFEQAMQEQSDLPVTRPSQTIANRVLLEMEKNPLPPIPAAVTPAQPLPTPERRSTSSMPIPAAPSPPAPPTLQRPKSTRNPLMPLIAGGAAVLVVLIVAVLGLFILAGSDDDDSNNSLMNTEVTQTPTATLSPEITVAASSFPPPMTDTPASAPPATTPAEAASYALLITISGDDAMVINNITQGASLPLAPLSISNDIETISGPDFGVDVLGPQECLVIAQDQERADKLQANCNRVGNPIFRDADKRFWRSEIAVSYNGISLATCAEATCIVQIAP